LGARLPANDRLILRNVSGPVKVNYIRAEVASADKIRPAPNCASISSAQVDELRAGSLENEECLLLKVAEHLANLGLVILSVVVEIDLPDPPLRRRKSLLSEKSPHANPDLLGLFVAIGVRDVKLQGTFPAQPTGEGPLPSTSFP
jgi:hypothetical protein